MLGQPWCHCGSPSVCQGLAKGLTITQGLTRSWRAEANPEEIALDDAGEPAAANPEELDIDDVPDDDAEADGASMFAAVEIHNMSAAGAAAEEREDARLPQALANVVAGTG